MQLLVVITPSWNAVQGTLCSYERATQNQPWTQAGIPLPVVVGQAGMVWAHQKKEGDCKTPAGIFALGPTFGRGAPPPKMDYLRLTLSIEAVDDPKSRYYNQIVNRDSIAEPDWQSSEKMGEIELYEIGIVIQHNWPNPIPSAGSAIFMHLWRNYKIGTAGCIAMSWDNLKGLLNWLDKEQQPKIVQLPRETYEKVKQEWNLPF